MIEVTAAIIERGGKVLAARRPPGDPLAGFWEFPGGKLEAGETHRQCLRRELEEELGVECEVGDFVLSNPHTYGDKQVRLHAYCVRLVAGEPQPRDHDRLCWLEPAALMALQWAAADIPIVERYQQLCAQRQTLDYYEQNASAYAEETRALPMEPLYSRFLALVPPAGRILDLGCGSGRDSLFFARSGYRVTAVDASPAMVAEAARLTGLEAGVMRAQQLEAQACYEGIWCSASLLHSPQAELPELFDRIARALVPEGVCYASFKRGAGERVDGRGRLFCDQTPESLAPLLQHHPLLKIESLWESRSPLRGVEQGWCNLLLRRR
ncbi:NUDIX domain-containing protein [Aestuariirhabdus litorea]|uniref:8-oxo-dGTP diphosphatase n=1 Tax=Aestuariirhabdus litorea TaxID=2528527 RepID=A0A3P3VRC6_9GAMM|nr:NUDIX domain-containing protein [Aestuariirhabdus litorea]RRJ84236.1 NUDIX domain-containing protein [Aestuariirhabdus litorea]RWW97458.1 NUDIX domain-containing protein [Endozoicomonadaceae bacterium GTF-13]